MRVVLALWIACAASVAHANGSELTLEQVLVTGRAMQPSMRMAEANREAAWARARQARAPLLPQVTTQAQYQRTTSNYVLRPGSLPANLRAGQTTATNKSYDFFSAQASVNQLVYDFGATWGAFRAATGLAQAQDHNTRASLLAIEYDLRNAYLVAFAAQALVEVGEQTLQNAQQHLAQIEHAVQAGTQADIDLFTAKSTVASAEVTLLGYRNQLLTDKLALNQSMGLDAGIDYRLVAPSLPTLSEMELVANHQEGLAEQAHDVLAQASPWVSEALSARPELQQFRTQLQAQQHKATGLWRQHLPSLSLTGSITEQGERIDQLAYNWSALGVVSWNAFTGGRIQAQVQEAQATLRALRAAERALHLSIRTAVHNGCLGLVAGRMSRRAADVALQSADKRLRLAEGRYRAGVGNILELSDAQVARTQAASDVVQADFRWLTARAQVLFALGRNG